MGNHPASSFGSLSRAPTRATWLALLFGAVGCSGLISGPLEPSFETPELPDPNEPEKLEDVLSIPEPDRHPNIRKLTNTELAGLYEELVGFVPTSLQAMPPTRRDYLHDTVAQSQSISQLHVSAYGEIANEVANALVPSRINEWAPGCAQPAGAAQTSCAQTFAAAFTSAAFRRPTPASSLADATSLYESAASYHDGIKQIVRYSLMSPYTNYLVEEGPTVDDYDLASRLSFALCRRPPDAELLAAAAQGQLTNPTTRMQIAATWWNKPCAQSTVTSFFLNWLGADGALAASRPANRFPEFNAVLAASMVQETRTFITHAVFTQQATLPSLITANTTFVNQAVGELYGVEVSGDDFVPIQLPPSRRGVLTHPSVLTATAKPNSTSPVNRGLFVLERLMCATIPAPPNNVTPPEQEPGDEVSPRELWQRHVSDPNCSTCHRFMDPVGFAFEGFDEIGQERIVDHAGYPIDDRGGLPLLGVPMGELAGVADLAPLVASSPRLPACFARQWLRYALGRLEQRHDRESILTVARALHEGASLRDGMLELFRTEAFERRYSGDFTP